jgi:anhydro-N-acetylmuramic acid kinase
MFKQKYSIIGVMSGTSLDGVDLAHIHFSIIDGKWHYEILACDTIAYDEVWLNKLKTAVDFSAEKLVQQYLGQARCYLLQLYSHKSQYH